jgi:hypothetical protein
MDDSRTFVGSNPPNNSRRRRMLILGISLPACIVLVGLGWQAYEHIQEARDRTT